MEQASWFYGNPLEEWLEDWNIEPAQNISKTIWQEICQTRFVLCVDDTVRRGDPIVFLEMICVVIYML
jgi:hypothetical protein